MAEGGPKKTDEKSSSESDDDCNNPGDKNKVIEMILRKFATAFGMDESSSQDVKKVLDEATVDGVASYIKADKCKNVIVLVGAGMSTSAGIPDFRSAGTGLYHNLEKYNLPYPMAIFELPYFLDNPQPFFTLSKELFPTGPLKPTPCHYFVRLLHEKGMLRRIYTQNIDTLERVAGIPEEKIVEAHGTFNTSHCLKCRKEFSLPWMKEKIFADQMPTCDVCENVVKPDIIFFGENLPSRFYTLLDEDFPKCDLLIIIGTSLVVQPFASLVSRVPKWCPRLLINKEKAGESVPVMSALGFDGMDFDSTSNTRDVCMLGLCDDECLAFAEKVGWGDELKKLVKDEHANITK